MSALEARDRNMGLECTPRNSRRDLTATALISIISPMEQIVGGKIEGTYVPSAQ